MRPLSPVPPCQLVARRRVQLLGGTTVSAVVLAAVLTANPAFAADSTVTGKGGVQSAFANAGAAGATADVVTLGDDLSGSSGSDDRLLLGPGKALTLDLNGHKLAVDRIEVQDGSTLTIKDSDPSQRGRLLVGTPDSAPASTAGTGIVLDDSANLVADSVFATVIGSSGHAAIGGSAAEGATVTVIGSTHLTATGGTGSAAIGGDTGANGTHLVVEGPAQVDATAGQASSPASSPAPSPASPVGAGQNGAASGDTSIGAGAKLTTHGALQVTDGAVLANDGTLVLDGTALGAGVVQNVGTISGTTEQIDADLSIEGHNYKVTLDKEGGTGETPASVRFYRGAIGDALGDFTPTRESKRFVGWNLSANGDGVGTNTHAYGTTHATSDQFDPASASQDGEPTELTAHAIYRDRVTFQTGAFTDGVKYLRRGATLLPTSVVSGDDITSVTATGNPTWLTVSSDGKFSGIAPTGTNADFVVTLSVSSPHDPNGPVTHQFRFVVGTAPAVTTTSTSVDPLLSVETDLPPVTLGNAYTGQVLATAGGNTTIGEGVTYVATDPAGLAARTGLTLEQDGIFSGTATGDPGSYPFQVKATSSRFGGSVVKSLTLHLGEKPAITTTNTDLQFVTNEQTYPSAKGHFSASGTTDLGAVTFTTDAASLLARTGLALNADGTFSGTAHGTVGEFQVVVTAHSRYGGSTPVPFTMHLGNAPTITTDSIDPLTIGKSYPATGDHAIRFQHGGTEATTVWSAPVADLPPGLSIDPSTGVLSGTLAAPSGGVTARTYAFIVTATNDYGVRTRPYLVRTGQAPQITTSTVLPKASVGGLYEKSLSLTGDQVGVPGDPTSGVHWSLSNDAPEGLEIDQSGRIHGSIGDAGTSHFSATAVTAFGTVTKSLELTADLGAGLLMRDPGPITVGTAWSADLANGGSAVTYTAVGALPAGLTLHPDGTISADVSEARSFVFTIKASNAYGTTKRTYHVEAGEAPVVSTLLTLGVEDAAVALDLAVDAEGVGARDATWSKVSGSYPTGVDLDGDALVGSFDAVGTFHFTLKATTAFGSATRDYTVIVGAAPAIATAALPDGTVDAVYRLPVVVSGDGEVVVDVEGLPDGLEYSAADHAIVGTPTEAGAFSVTITADSAFGPSASVGPLDLAVAAAPVVPPVTPAPSATTPAPAPSTPAPAPSTPAPAPSTPAPVKTTPAPTPVLVAPVPVLPTIASTTAKYGHPLALSVAASSATKVAYSLAGGDLPKGVSLDGTTGVISGTPTEEGTFTATVQATNAAGSSTTSVTIVVPKVQELVKAKPDAVTLRSGAPVAVTIKGLKKGETWTVKVDGKVKLKGLAKSTGNLSVSVPLKRSLRDKAHTIRVSGSRTVSDPAKRASTTFTVTTVSARKSLALKANGRTGSVARLAAGESVTVVLSDQTVVTRGVANADGVFAFSLKSLPSGKHTLVATGSTEKRTDKLKVVLG